jgi:7-keto-8-aminopelargonate synthetase-like enzyme
VGLVDRLKKFASRLEAARGPAAEALAILAGRETPAEAEPRAPGPDVFDKCFRFRTADDARAMGVYPFFRPVDRHEGPEAQIDGRRVLMLGSYDYLGLGAHPRVREAARAAIDRHGTTCPGSRLSSGTLRIHAELEARLAAYHGREAGLVFSSGYQALVAAVSALLSEKKGVSVLDRDVHASIYDGARQAQARGARLVRYQHGDPGSLDHALSVLAREDYAGGALVCTEGVSSAQGEIADLPALLAVVKKHGARLLVDDAHALGVIGTGGRGTGSHHGIADRIDLVGGSLSKSLASTGGWLVGDRKVLDYVQHFSHGFLFTTSPPPASVAAATAALGVLEEEPWRMGRLRDNFTYLRTELQRLGFDVGRTATAIVPVYLRDDLKTLRMWKSLLDDHAVYTTPFITPGVPPRQQALRTITTAAHERVHLDRALDAFEKVGKRFGVIR